MDTREIIARAGGPSRVGRAIERHYSSVIKWSHVPAAHVTTVARLAGLLPHEVRPDIFPSPGARARATRVARAQAAAASAAEAA